MLSHSLKIESTSNAAKDTAWLQSAFDLLKCSVTLGYDVIGHETLTREDPTIELSTRSDTAVTQVISLLSDLPPPEDSQGKVASLTMLEYVRSYTHC